jgi:MFS family permease
VDIREARQSIGRALGHRNFRLFFFGQSISLIGTWMQQTAMIWLVYRLSNSPFLLGLVGFASQIPVFVVSPVAGVLTDRWNRHRTVMIAQTAAMLHGIALTVLTMMGWITVWQIIALAVVLGIISGFDMPSRQAFLIDMVDDREHLGNAIALNSSMFNGARLVGPALAGLVIAWHGEWMCFMINSVSYVAVLIALAAMRLRPVKRAVPKYGIVEGMAEGFRYAIHSEAIRTILALVALVSLVCMPLMVLLPVIAKDILHGGPDTLGILTASTGFGATIGAIMLAMKKSVLGMGKVVARVTTLLGVAMIGVAISNFMLASLVFLTLTGFATMVEMAASNTILQTVVEDDKRGRIMSLYTMAFMGMAPIGSLLAGGLASTIGTPWTLVASGLVCLCGSAAFALRLPKLRETVRPIYIEAGILPEVTLAIERSEELTTPPED